MRVADEAEPLKALKDADEFAGIGVDVVGKNVFVDRPPRRGMNATKSLVLSAPADCPETSSDWPGADRVRVFLKTPARPVTRLLGPAVEIERLIEDRKS
jgi:hypothetical protein